MSDYREQWIKDCNKVQKYCNAIETDYSISDIARATGLDNPRAYKCWSSLLNKKKISENKTVNLVKKEKTKDSKLKRLLLDAVWRLDRLGEKLENEGKYYRKISKEVRTQIKEELK